MQFEPLLSALCSKVQPLHSNDSQSVWLTGDASEARLAYDLLLAYGFDAKLYPEGGNQCRLYITQPSDPVSAERKLAAAMKYASSLKSIKHHLDSLRDLGVPSYQMSFTNASGGNRQITIQIREAGFTEQPVAPTSPATAAASPATTAARPAAAGARRPAAGNKRPASSGGGLSSGPSVGKASFGAHNDANREGLFRNFYLSMMGRQGAGFMILGAIIGGLLLAFLVFGLMRMALCRDFAVQHKSSAWYCDQPEEKKHYDAQ